MSDLVLTAYQQEQEPPHPIDVGTSTWRRAPDLSHAGPHQDQRELPDRPPGPDRGPQPRLRGHDPAEPVRARGGGHRRLRAAWCATGASTRPPASEGALESITLDIIGELAEVDRASSSSGGPIDRSELYIADELGLTGTLAEITEVRSIDDQQLPAETADPVGARRALPRRGHGREPHPAVELDGRPGLAPDRRRSTFPPRATPCASSRSLLEGDAAGARAGPIMDYLVERMRAGRRRRDSRGHAAARRRT